MFNSELYSAYCSIKQASDNEDFCWKPIGTANKICNEHFQTTAVGSIQDFKKTAWSFINAL